MLGSDYQPLCLSQEVTLGCSRATWVAGESLVVLRDRDGIVLVSDMPVVDANRCDQTSSSMSSNIEAIEAGGVVWARRGKEGTDLGTLVPEGFHLVHRASADMGAPCG